GVSVGDGVDPVQGRGVIRVRRQADPDLPEVDPGDLLAEQAWPMCAPALCTPGMASSSLLILVVDRSISAADVPGGETQWMRKSCSLMAGNSDWLSCGIITMPMVVSSVNMSLYASGY